MAKPFYGFQPTGEQLEVIKAIETFVAGELEAVIGEDGLPMFDHTHLDLAEGSFSTHFEGVYSYRDDVASAVANAIMERRLVLPEGFWFELYSSIEMYFYKD